MDKSYEDYKKFVYDLMNGNSDSYKKAVNDGLVVERKYSMNGEPYRYLTELEWLDKFKLKN